MYAVIEDSGTRFRVSQGDVMKIDLRDLPEDATDITFDRVLLIGGDEVKVGTPLVDGAKVTAEIVNAVSKGPKIHVHHWRRRKASRKKIGHRQKYVEIRITKISA